MYGETEEEIFAYAKKHGMDVHGYTEETWNEEISENKDHFRSLIKKIRSIIILIFIMLLVLSERTKMKRKLDSV